ncbi:MAG: HDOD domain-containing protein [Bacteroidota bacterium]
MSLDITKDSSLSASQVLGLERAEGMLRGIMVPPRPEVLVAVLSEQQKPEPDLERLATIIERDVALAASTLKVINSPFYGLVRKIGSVHHGVRLLGLQNVVHLVTGLMLHSAFKDGTNRRFMDAFWTMSNRRAMVAARVSDLHPRVGREEAHAVGLFCDCGVPMMLRRFPEEYPTTFRIGMLADVETLRDREQQAHQTDHTLVGYIVARSWKLPDVFCQTILRHHDAEDYFSTPDPDFQDVLPMLSVIRVANYLLRCVSGLPEQPDWQATRESLLDYLSITTDDLVQLEAELNQVLD